MTRINYEELEDNKTKLDVKDKKILDILSENSRIPSTTISKKFKFQEIL